MRQIRLVLTAAVVVAIGVNSHALAEEQKPSGNSPSITQSSCIEKEVATEAEPKKPGTPQYEFREQHDPYGIGKFYFGREIAYVMGYAGAIWLEREEREDEEAPSKLIKTLRLREGQVIADIGAGSGVLSVMMAREVGATGKVLAVDVQQEMLDLLEKKLKKLNVTNVERILGTEKSPSLKPASVDLAIMVDVYHEFAFPYEMMLEISKSMKPGGRVVFVEYRKEDPNVPIRLVHKMTEAQVKREIAQPEFGLKWKETIGILPRQHIVIFERVVNQPADAPVTPEKK